MEKRAKRDEEQRVEDFSMKEFFQECVRYWKWFLVSMVFFVGVIGLYVYTREPVYERMEQVLVKDQDNGGGVGDIASAFSSMGLVASNTNVNNELITLTSPHIMYEVVKRLGLDMDYVSRKGLHPWTLYKSTLPINVELPGISDTQGGGLQVILHPDGSKTLRKFYMSTPDGKEKFSDEIELKKGQESVKTPIGEVKISANPNYTGKPIDEEMKIRVAKSPMQVAVEKYGKKLSGDLTDPEAQVIDLTVKDVCVARAVDILELILTVYNENWVEDKNKLARATSTFIDERLSVIQSELGEVDNSIVKQTEAAGTPDLETTATLNMEKNESLTTTVVNLTNQLAMVDYVSEYLADKGNAFKVLPVNSGVGSESIEAEIAAYNKQLLERNTLVDNSSTSNPLVQSYDKTLEGQRQAIVNGLENHGHHIRNLIRSAKSEIGRTKGNMMSTPRKALPLLSEERQQKVKENLYLFLLQKREENELSQKFTADNLRLITPPMGSLKPVSPKKKLLMALAVLLGLTCPVCLIYVRKSGDNKVRSRKDLEGVAMPFAGEIPQVGKAPNALAEKIRERKHKKEETAPLAVVEPGKRDVVNEAFRVIRGNLDFMSGKEKGCKVVMFTSFNPGSGKSFISYNLGISFALKKKRVLVVDCDLRHGSASMYVGSPRKGLTDWLTGESGDWKQLVCKTDNPDLQILPTGKMPPNPAELLDGGRLKELLEQARSDYDYIFLDCPPVNIVVDTQIIAQYADMTVFVTRAGLLERQALSELDELYTDKRYPRMCLILNGTEAVHSRYYTYGNYQSHAE